MNRKLGRFGRTLFALWLSLTIVGAGTVAHAAPALSEPAAPAEQAATATGLPAVGPFAVGTVIGLRGTSHLWFVDDLGTLHWGGDTRALAGKPIRWDLRVDVTLDQLNTLPRKDPWLSAGLVKIGDPIYFVKWESTDPAPTLLHIQSIADVELFGINASNYGNFVLDRGAWEARFGMRTDNLARGVLAPAAGTAGALPSAGWVRFSRPNLKLELMVPPGSVEIPDQSQTGDLQGVPVTVTATGVGRIVGTGSVAYVVSRMDFPPEVDLSSLPPALIAASTVVGFIRSSGGQLVSERPISVGAHQGYELRIEGSRGTPFFFGRVITVGQRVYFLLAGAQDESQFADAARFLDSLVVLP